MKSSFRKLGLGAVLIAGAVSLALFAGSVSAGTSASTLSVTATVQNQCVVTTGVLTLANSGGVIQPAIQVDGTGSAVISAKCTKGTTIGFIQLDKGANPTGTTTFVRHLKNGANTMAYLLCSDSAVTCATPWGDTAANTDGLGNYFSPSSGNVAASNGTPLTFTVYGQLPFENQDVPAGTYTDTVNVTVNY